MGHNENERRRERRQEAGASSVTFPRYAGAIKKRSPKSPPDPAVKFEFSSEFRDDEKFSKIRDLSIRYLRNCCFSEPEMGS